MDQLLSDNWPFVVAAWAAIFVLDHELTLVGAAQRALLPPESSVSGSYEMNPAFVADIDRGSHVTPRLLGALIAYAALLGFTGWFVSLRHMPAAMFAFCAGALIFASVPVLLAHIDNLARFHWQRTGELVVRFDVYPRHVSQRAHAVRYLFFAVMWTVLFATSWQWFFAGGAFGSVVLSWRFWVWARAAAQVSAPSPEATS